jgi:hypothetical protein
LITDVDPKSTDKIEPMKFIELAVQVFPKVCGVAKLSGLVIIDAISNKKFDFYTDFFA